MTTITSYKPENKEEIFQLLSFLPERYPNSLEWLNKKLDNPQTTTYMTTENNVLTGISIIGLKPNNTIKISTFYIKPEETGKGLGTTLLSQTLQYAETTTATHIYITANSKLDDTLGTFLKKHGFVLITSVHGKYHSQEIENIYQKQLKL